MARSGYEAMYMDDNLTSPYDNAHLRENTVTRRYDAYDDTANYGSTHPAPSNRSHTYEYPRHVPSGSAPACPPPRPRQQVTANPLQKEKSGYKWLTVAFGVTTVIFIAAFIIVFCILLTTETVTQNNTDMLERIKRLENETGELLTFNGWYKASDNYYYKLFTDRATWNTAKSRCQALGGRLFTKGVKDAAVFREVQTNVVITTPVWIGYHDHETEGIWKWLDGSTGLRIGVAWTTGEPNGQDCAHIRPITNVSAITLNDAACDAFAAPYVCEKQI